MFTRLAHSLTDLVYPPLCLHCNAVIRQKSVLFCSSCQSLLELILPEERCPYCFSPSYAVEKKSCPQCMRTPPVLHRIAAAFDYVGPAATLVKKMKYADQPYLARGAGAFLAAQFLHLEWTVPDVVIPVPMSLTHWIDRGYNQSELLAQQFVQIIPSSIQNALERRSGDYSQAGLTLAQRMKLNSGKFYLKDNQNLMDKSILLIDDVMTSGSTLRKCAEVLFEAYPRSIYALTLCRALK